MIGSPTKLFLVVYHRLREQGQVIKNSVRFEATRYKILLSDGN